MVQAIFPSRTTILTTFASAEGESVGSTMDLPLSITAEQLELLINQLLNNDEHLPYSFFVDNVEIKQNIQTDIMDKLQKSTEDVVKIVFQPQAIFRVNAVSRCSSALSGASISFADIRSCGRDFGCLIQSRWKVSGEWIGYFLIFL